MEVAAASDQVLSGIALDWAKCYDRTSLALVAKTLRAAGWPTQVLAPLLSAYMQPRRLSVGSSERGAGGEAPARGCAGSEIRAGGQPAGLGVEYDV